VKLLSLTPGTWYDVVIIVACEWSLYQLYSGEQKGEISYLSQPTNQQLPEQQSPPPSQEPRNLLHEIGAADGDWVGDGVDDLPALVAGEDVAGGVVPGGDVE